MSRFIPICRALADLSHARKGTDLWVSPEAYLSYGDASKAAAKEHDSDKARGGNNWVGGMFCVANEKGEIVTPSGATYGDDPRHTMRDAPPFVAPEKVAGLVTAAPAASQDTAAKIKELEAQIAALKAPAAPAPVGGTVEFAPGVKK